MSGSTPYFVVQILVFIIISNLLVCSSEHDTSKFQHMMDTWEKQCTPEQNIILHHRAETFDAELAKNVTIETPWSLNRQSYDNTLEFCTDLSQLIDSMQSGKRIFINQNESYFRPKSCNFRWFDASQACEIFSRYALMAYRGDSLARHMTQATFMILADDVKYAGRAMDIHNAAINNTCVCDGQFSEHRFCKTGYDNAMFHAKDIHKYGLCKDTKNAFGFRFDTQIRKEYYPESKFDFCFDDPRPRLLMLEGGVHVGYDAQWMLNDIIKPVIFDLVVQEMLCEFKYPIHFIWVGADAQSRVLDAKYPKQTRENSNLYNEQINKAMKELYSPEVQWIVNVNCSIIVCIVFTVVCFIPYFMNELLVFCTMLFVPYCFVDLSRSHSVLIIINNRNTISL